MRGASRDSLATARERLDALAREQDGDVLLTLSQELLSVVVVVAASPALRRSLSDPALSGTAKKGLLDQLLGQRLAPSALSVLADLVVSRWSHPADFVDAVEVLAVQAAFTVAQADGSLDDVEDELFRFGRIIDRAPRLRAALTDPALPDEQKRALLHALLEHKVSTITLRLVDNVVLAPRGRIIDRAIEGLAEQAAQRRSRLIAAVRVAVPLTAAEHDRLAAGLRVEFGHDIRLQVEIDPAVQGGVVVRVGDQLIDASIARRLAETRRRLAG